MIWGLFMRKKKKPTVKIEITEEEHRLWTMWASKYDQSIEEWVKQTAKDKIPTDFRDKNPFLEGKDTESGSKDSKNEPKTAQSYIEDDLHHTCKYFSRAHPPNLTYRECLGSCHHASRSWQACNWHPSDARNCQLYMPRKK